MPEGCDGLERNACSAHEDACRWVGGDLGFCSLINNQRVRVLMLPPEASQYGLRGGGEDGMAHTDLQRDEDAGRGFPVEEIGFRCPDEPGTYSVSIRFKDVGLNGPATDRTDVVCRSDINPLGDVLRR